MPAQQQAYALAFSTGVLHQAPSLFLVGANDGVPWRFNNGFLRRHQCLEPCGWLASFCFTLFLYFVRSSCKILWQLSHSSRYVAVPSAVCLASMPAEHRSFSHGRDDFCQGRCDFFYERAFGIRATATQQLTRNLPKQIQI